MTAPTMTELVFSASRACLVQLGSPLPESFERSLKDRVQTARSEAQGTGSKPAEKEPKKVLHTGAVAKGAGPGRKSGPRGKRTVVPNVRSITVASLMEQGLIKEGDSIKVTHRGESAEGVLLKDGGVQMGNEKFASCADFSTAVKKRSQPNCRNDDGWRSCLVNGRSLHDYRSEILEV